MPEWVVSNATRLELIRRSDLAEQAIQTHITYVDDVNVQNLDLLCHHDSDILAKSY